MEKAIPVIYFNRYLNPLWPGGEKEALAPVASHHNLASIQSALSQPDMWALAKKTEHRKLQRNSLMRDRSTGDLKHLFGHSHSFIWLLFTELTGVHCCNLMMLSSQGWLSLLIMCVLFSWDESVVMLFLCFLWRWLEKQMFTALTALRKDTAVLSYFPALQKHHHIVWRLYGTLRICALKKIYIHIKLYFIALSKYCLFFCR